MLEIGKREGAADDVVLFLSNNVMIYLYDEDAIKYGEHINYAIGKKACEDAIDSRSGEN